MEGDARPGRHPFVRTFWAAGGLALGLAAAFMALVGSAPTGPDAAGYLTPARVLAEEGTLTLTLESPAQLVGRPWLETDRGDLVPRYAPGLLAIQALGRRLGGIRGALAVVPLAAALSVFLFFLLARRWVGPGWALAGSVVFGTLPLMGEFALLGFAHWPVVALLLAGLLHLERWRERARSLDGLLAGAFLGILPAFRHPTAVFGSGLAAYALWSAPSVQRRRALAWVVAGAALPLGLLAGWQWATFGSPVRTGYSLTLESAAFSLRYLAGNVPRYGAGLLFGAGPPVVLGGLGMLWMANHPRWRARGWLLLALVVPHTLLYLTYYWPFALLRFLLPSIPLYVLATLVLLKERLPSVAGRAALAAVVAFQLAFYMPASVRALRQTSRWIERSELVVDGVASVVPEGGVVVASDATETLLDVYGRWRLVEWTLLWPGPLPEPPSYVPAPLSPEGRRQASPTQPEKARALRGPLLTADGEPDLERVLDEVARWSGGVFYWVGDAAWIARVRGRTARPIEFETVGSIPPGGRPDPLSARGEQPAWWMPELPVEVFRVRIADPTSGRSPP